MDPMDIDHDAETPGKKGVKDSQKLSFGAPFLGSRKLDWPFFDVFFLGGSVDHQSERYFCWRNWSTILSKGTKEKKSTSESCKLWV